MKYGEVSSGGGGASSLSSPKFVERLSVGVAGVLGSELWAGLCSTRSLVPSSISNE